MHILDELAARGLVKEITDPDGLRRALDAGPLTFYCGYDPTATSLHVGNLVPLSTMARLARAGHRMIALIGGATGMIGDPSGKSQERRLLEPETLQRNQDGIGGQIARLVSDEARLVNNADWFAKIDVLTFLRVVGKNVTVNYMLDKESVRARLEDREQGISYTEFSYMLLQGYDFVHLGRELGCRLQIGGSDQWGNITCGIELGRRIAGLALFGLVTPLLLTAAGTKFGKSEKGNTWLDAAQTSPYRFYQFWLNQEDVDVERFLKMFTFLSLEEIAGIAAAHAADPARRVGQRRLAQEVTTWIHGGDAVARAEKASGVVFGGSLEGLGDADLEPLLLDLPSSTRPRAELAAGLPLLDLLHQTGLVDSKGAARRLLQQGGVYVNNVRQSDAAKSLGEADLATKSMMLLRAGKKAYHIVRFE